MKTIEDIQAWFDDHHIHRVKIGGFDIDGVLRGKYVTPEKFFSAAKKGMGFCDVIFGWDVADVLYDNAEVTGWHSGYPDLDATVDLSTARLIPWEPGVAAFLLDFDEKVSPRSVLKRAVEKASGMGFGTKFACEFEFFVFDENPHSAREKGWQNLTSVTPGMFGYSWIRSSQNADLLHDLMDGLEAFGCRVEGLHTETGPGVYEAALEATDAMSAADQGALFKTAVKEICSRHGLMASFMAKWSTDYPGCSGHIHQSLWKGDENAFAGDGENGTSETMMHYLAGQLTYARELTAFYAPTINSYKRYVPGTWAPTHVAWGWENRTCGARVITGPGDGAKRIEWRQGGADINPYLAIGAALASGLAGIEQKLTPTAPTTGNAYDLTDADAPRLPSTLREATDALAGSDTAGGLLGETFVDHFVKSRDWECREYDKMVSGWELDRYFELV